MPESLKLLLLHFITASWCDDPLFGILQSGRLRGRNDWSYDCPAEEVVKIANSPLFFPYSPGSAPPPPFIPPP